MSKPPAKRRRINTELTKGEKKELCQHKKSHPSTTQSELHDIFTKKFGKKFGRATVCEILKRSDHWLAVPEAENSQKRDCIGRQTELEAALYLWSQEVRVKGSVLSDELLREKAVFFGKKLNVDDFE